VPRVPSSGPPGQHSDFPFADDTLKQFRVDRASEPVAFRKIWLTLRFGVPVCGRDVEPVSGAEQHLPLDSVRQLWTTDRVTFYRGSRARRHP
jgi:hypothetical protein